MLRTVTRALLLAVAGTVLGLTGNTLSPKRIPLIAPVPPPVPDGVYVPLDEAQKLWQQTGLAFFFDARDPEDYAAGHIALAHSLPVHDFDEIGRAHV